MSTSIQAAAMGYGFAWFPQEKIHEEIVGGRLKVLPLREGGERRITLYLIFADPDYAGAGTLKLAEILREHAALGARVCAEKEAEEATKPVSRPRLARSR
jgi:DNA-binding transcriptional LysR family regulator